MDYQELQEAIKDLQEKVDKLEKFYKKYNGRLFIEQDVEIKGKLIAREVFHKPSGTDVKLTT